jgi:DnaJ-class molecular chaperone
VEVIDSNLDDRKIDCGECDGSGRKKSVHSKCVGRGKLDCKNCLNGNREITCEDCDGTGNVSLIDATVVKYEN